MKIAPLRDRVTFYQRKIVQDEIGNESSEWKVLFSRWCSARLLSESETENGSVIRTDKKLRLTLRYHLDVLFLDTTKTKVHFNEVDYNIQTIDGYSVPRELIYMDIKKEESHEED
ncbi:phage head closure protein [Streptococcus iniae]|uniref:phage head closure protein n=1 Tax=Streptococcus iniae TaxID=1346 RepID=UPI000EFC83CA|nr:phage head closure protein [Streptococcus iniae]RMI73791.1 head-tail adaptor protein [Streptococcus iniae]